MAQLKSGQSTVMTGPRSCSIQDVARVAKVSTATVSRVLNAPHVVAPDTADRVRRAVRDLGYRPNPFAKGLMTSQSKVIGIALPDIHGEFYSEVIRGADAEAHRRGYHLLVSSEARVSDQSDNLAFGLIDGMAIMITEPDDSLWHEARQNLIPCVVIDAESDESIDSVAVDNETGSREAIAHLLKSVSPDKCFFVGGPRENYDTTRRAEAFATTLREYGHRVSPEQIAFGKYDVEWGELWTERALRHHGSLKGLGVLAANDEIAFGIIRVAQDAGLTVPGDVRVIGFDDTRLASLIRPRLTTVRIPLSRVGAAAISMLIDRIERPDSPPRRVILPTELVIRESSTP